jgi:hypothetical protein
MTSKPNNEPYEPRKYPATFGKIHLIDFPRCGAKRRNKAELCKAPSMANGRCRLHGGLSTGPRTPEGLIQSKQANLKHGEYSQESKEELRAMMLGMRLLLSPAKVQAMNMAEMDTHIAALERISSKRLSGELSLFRKPAKRL